MQTHRREAYGKMEGSCSLKPKNHSRHEKLKEVKEILPLEYLKGSWPCQHLDFQILASRIVRDSVYVVFSHQICGDLLQQPRETIRGFDARSRVLL